MGGGGVGSVFSCIHVSVSGEGPGGRYCKVQLVTGDVGDELLMASLRVGK